jgi:hypothetical protein
LNGGNSVKSLKFDFPFRLNGSTHDKTFDLSPIIIDDKIDLSKIADLNGVAYYIYRIATNSFPIDCEYTVDENISKLNKMIVKYENEIVNGLFDSKQLELSEYCDLLKYMLYFDLPLKPSSMEKIIWTILNNSNFDQEINECHPLMLILKLKNHELSHDITNDIYEKITKVQNYFDFEVDLSKFGKSPFDIRWYFLWRRDIDKELKENILMGYYETSELSNLIKMLTESLNNSAIERAHFAGREFTKKDIGTDAFNEFISIDKELDRQREVCKLLDSENRIRGLVRICNQAEANLNAYSVCAKGDKCCKYQKQKVLGIEK